MNIQHLRYFEVIAYHQNLSKAAQQLMVSQPSLSNVLFQLENELGVQLFDRLGKKLVLNHAGELFLGTVQDVLHLLDDSVAHLKDSTLLSGRLRICAHISCPELYQAIAAFTRQHPDVQIRLYNADKLIGNPQLSAYDLVVLPDYECGDLPHIFLGTRHTMYAVLPQGHRLAQRKTLALEELRDEYFCFHSPRDNRLEHAYNRCLEAGFTPKIRYVVDNTASGINLMLTGSCITLVYNTNTPYLQCWNHFVTIPLEELPQARRSICLCLPSDTPAPLAKRFFEFVPESCPPPEAS